MATKYDKMTMAQLKAILKKNGINFSEKDKDVLADAVHQFDAAGMLNNTTKKKAGQRVGTANYPGKKKVQPTPEELKGMKKKESKNKTKKKNSKPRGIIGQQYDKLMGKPITMKKGGKVGTHNRLY
jgi:ribosomal protein L12E/L44/L45/RPP1/RPP2|tara:strand:+ start:1850 stop:2227 length:378 start_codon:yes stop_codon:yes gene_type:complete